MKQSKLKYLNEHLACKYYAKDEGAVLGMARIKAGELFIREDVARSTLVFILTGHICVSTKNVINMPVEQEQMFLVSAGDSFFGKADTDVVLFRCSFTQDMALCNKYALNSLLNHLPAHAEGETPHITVLPVHELLLREIELTCSLMDTGLFCIHYQRIKQEIIFMVLRGMYSRKELALMFRPLLGVDGDFKSKVLHTYPKINTAKELMDELRMSPTAFNRKFQISFGTSAKQWLIQKKKEKLLRDIIMTDCPIMELAEKYNLTVNYLTTFCKEHFGRTPTEIRQQNRPSSGKETP